MATHRLTLRQHANRTRNLTFQHHMRTYLIRGSRSETEPSTCCRDLGVSHETRTARRPTVAQVPIECASLKVVHQAGGQLPRISQRIRIRPSASRIRSMCPELSGARSRRPCAHRGRRARGVGVATVVDLSPSQATQRRTRSRREGHRHVQLRREDTVGHTSPQHCLN